MKILFSCLSRSWGGMEMYTVLLISRLQKIGFDCRLICYPDSRIEKESFISGIKTYAVKSSGYFHPLQIIKLARLIKQNNFNLIHSQASKDLWTIVPALKFSGSSIPLFLTKHLGSFIVKKDFIHKIIYKRVNQIFAISNVIAKNLIDTCPVTEEKVTLLHNGIDTEKYDPQKINPYCVRNEYGISKDKIVVGMIARFSPGKGHEEFLFAADELLKKYDNLVFMIVGEPSAGEHEYAELIKFTAAGLKHHSKIIFTGYRKDIPEVLAAMDIFAFPSHAEAFGLALVEAMAMGKPSVCSASDGVLDIAVEGETAYMFEKQNKYELKEKLEQLILSPVKRSELGKVARLRAVEYFDEEVMINRLTGFYNSYLNSK